MGNEEDTTEDIIQGKNLFEEDTTEDMEISTEVPNEEYSTESVIEFGFKMDVPNNYNPVWAMNFAVQCYNLFLLFFYFCMMKFIYQVITTKIHGGK